MPLRREADAVDPQALLSLEVVRYTRARVVLFDMEGAAVMQNPAAIRTFGPLEGKGDELAALFIDAAEAARARREVEEGGVYSAEAALATLAGPRWHGMDARRVTDPVSGADLVLVNAREVEDRRAAEAAHLRSLQSQKRFLAAMSHEIRTPLNSVIGYLELLRASALDEPQQRHADNASVSAQHLLALVSDVLDVSKIEADQLELRPEEVDLEELLLEALIMSSSRVRPGVELSYLLADLDSFVRVDPLRIRQIFVNLLGNAAKFTEEGFIRLVLLEPEILDEATIAVTVAVEDSGIGIPEEKISALFAPFRQAHGAEHGGTGLGLFLSRSFARLMGGDITVDSTVGLGSRFAVRLVLDRGRSRGDPSAFAGKRALILTPDAELGRLLEERFADASAEVARPFPPTPAAALGEVLGRPPFDAVVIDLDLCAHAAAFATVLRMLGASPSIVALAPHGSAAAQGAPFDAVLPKPFSFYRLAKTLRELRGAGDEGALAGKPDLSDMKVLVVEDVEMNVGLMREVFQLWFGIGFAVARDGLEAVEKIRAGDFDLVFMDLQLPRLDGIEATRRVRELGLAVPIVALTANALSEDVEQAKAAGMNGYITKPVRRAELTRALYRHAPGAPISLATPPARISRPGKGPPRARLSGTVRLSLPPAMAARKRTQEMPAHVPPPPRAAEVIVAPEPLRDRARRHFEATFGASRVERLLMLSMDGVRAKLIELSGACAEDERPTIAAALHGIRGVLLNSGLDEVGERAGQLEREAKAGRAPDPEGLSALCDALRDYVGQEET